MYVKKKELKLIYNMYQIKFSVYSSIIQKI